jgi:hypothetical protein
LSRKMSVTFCCTIETRALFWLLIVLE